MSTAVKITKKQEIWIDVYKKTLSVRKANKAADYKSRNTAAKSPVIQRVLASELERAGIQDSIEKRGLVDKLLEITTASIFDFVHLDVNGEVLSINNEAIKDYGHLIKSFKVGKDGGISIVLEEKTKAIYMLMKYHNLYEKHNQSLSEPLARAIETLVKDNKPETVIELARDAIKVIADE